MDDFLWGVENIADSLAAIYDIGLIQYTLNALDSDYGIFVDALIDMHGMLAFDDVCNKLLVHEHRIQFLKHHNNGSLTHSAFVSNIVSSLDAGSNPQP